MNITFKEIQYGSAEYLEALALREKILRKPLGLEFTDEFLSQDKEDYHLAAIDEKGKIVATIQLKPLSDNSIKMRQAAVDEHLQGKKIGKQMILFSEQFLAENSFKTVELHARKNVAPFYKKLGYITTGKEFTEIQIPHIKMTKTLSVFSENG